jgi:hypothetical protein
VERRVKERKYPEVGRRAIGVGRGEVGWVGEGTMFKLERARLQYWSSENHLWELMLLYGGLIERGHNALGVFWEWEGLQKWYRFVRFLCSRALAMASSLLGCKVVDVKFVRMI